MAEYFGGGHLQFLYGGWRDDDGNIVEIEEVKHGKWIISKIEYGWNCAEYPIECKCSYCGGTVPSEERDYIYCPRCGAKMDAQ